MAQIRDFTQPFFLYRYRSLANIDREIEAIQEAYVYCSSYSDMNDPMEGFFQASAFMRSHPKQKELFDFIKNRKSLIGIASFSEARDHELMWAHYADQFKGICVEYDLYKLLTFMGNQDFSRISYVDNPPPFDFKRANLNEKLKVVLSSKQAKWAYEREWRLFQSHIGQAEYHDTSCISHVYFGSRVSTLKKDRLIEILNRLGIPFSSMRINGYAFEWA